jgi:hypothetical protein
LMPRLVERHDQRRWSQQLDRAARSYDGERGRARDYTLLAGLAGLSPVGYERSSAATRARARLEINRQLAERRRLLDYSRAFDGPGWRRATPRDAGGDTARLVSRRRARQFGSHAR